MTNIDDVMATGALEAVECMNAVFSGLDKVIDKHNVYKVRRVKNTKEKSFQIYNLIIHVILDLNFII